MRPRRTRAAFFAAVATLMPVGFVKAQAPTTQVLAIGVLTPGSDQARAQAMLKDEVQATVRLYLEGRIAQWFSLKSQRGVVFILNLTDVGAAQDMLGRLPLARAHLMTFQVMPIGPLNPLAGLLTPPAGQDRAGSGRTALSSSLSIPRPRAAEPPPRRLRTPHVRS